MRQQQVGRRRARRGDADGGPDGEQLPPEPVRRATAPTARLIEDIDELLAAV